MPCRDDYPDPTYNDGVNAGKESGRKLGIAQAKRELEPLLCEACDLLEQAGKLKKASVALKTWAKEHEEKEKERVAKEAAAKLKKLQAQEAAKREAQAKERALAKLTPKERRALGLK